MKRDLERVEIPGEREARERAWPVLRTAFAERERAPRERHPLRLAVAVAVLVAAASAALSPPGRAVFGELREVVGVERAERALFSLPGSGRLLVASDAGVWIVERDGSKRLLGDYREASWSPFGRFVVAARRDELAALEPDGDVRWTLARPGVRSPRWSGTESDTRIAYLSRSGLRVVAGDGSGDRLLARRVALVAPAWRPQPGFELAYADPRGRVVLVRADTGRVLWRSGSDGRVAELEWSPDGKRLVARRAGAVDDLAVYTPRGALYTGVRIPRGSVTAVATRPGSHTRALASRLAGRSRLWIEGLPGTLLTGAGTFEDLSWSPDGRWLVAGWPAADQWVFVRSDGTGIRAVSNVSDQFRSTSFPRIEGWCCARG